MKIKVTMGVGLHGCNRVVTVEVPKDEYEGLTEDEKLNSIDNFVQELIWNYIHFDWEEVESQ